MFMKVGLILRMFFAPFAALALCGGASAEPTQPVALFVDVAKEHVPEAALQSRQFDLNGLPVVVGSGPSSDVGLEAGRRIDLGAGFSLDSAASAKRQVVPGAIFAHGPGMGEMKAGTTARYQQGGWDIALFPELSTARLISDRLPGFAMGGSVARTVDAGWSLAATSRYELRDVDMPAAAAGRDAQGEFGVAGLHLLGTELDLGYLYDWTQPVVNAAKLSHGPSVALDLGLSDALNCRVAYHYAFAGEIANTGPAFAWLGDGGQDLTMGWDWDLAAEGLRGTTFGAAFAYHQDFFAAAAPSTRSVGINFATAF